MMVAKNISIIAPTLADSASENLILSIKISESNVSYAVFDKSKKNILAIEKWNLLNNDELFGIKETLNKIVNDSFVLKNTFQKTFVLLDNPVFTLVPDKIYSIGDEKKYLELDNTFNLNEKINIDKIDKTFVKNIYLLPAELEIAANKMFSNVEFMHTSSILIKSMLSVENKNEVVLINFSNKRIDVIISKNKKLLYCNTFNFISAEDIIYFILNIYNQLSLDTSVVPVMIAGNIEKNSTAYQIIFKYIKNVSFCSKPANCQYFQSIQELPEHLNYCLFNSFTCE